MTKILAHTQRLPCKKKKGKIKSLSDKLIERHTQEQSRKKDISEFASVLSKAFSREKKNTNLSKKEKVMQALETDIGGKIDRKKIKRKEGLVSQKLMEAHALDVQKGGKIDRKKIKRKEQLVSQKLMEAHALDVQKGGQINFHDKRHKYLYEKLSGRGAGFDSVMCRKMMTNLLHKRHPSFYNTYVKGVHHDLPQNRADHLYNVAKPIKVPTRNHVTQFGGSLNGLSYSENGLLRSHDSEFHHQLEIV